MTKTYPAAFAAFEAANPVIAAWWNNTTFEFALSLRDQVLRGKVLSEKQMAAALKCAAPKSAPAPQPKSAVDVKLIEVAFNRANGNGIARPKMRLFSKAGVTYVISQAPAFGANAGALYVKRGDGAYMGKIRDGHFQRASDCDGFHEQDIIEACGKPEETSVAYGRAFGSCSVCSRTLTNALSIELGIGPICRGNFFG